MSTPARDPALALDKPTVPLAPCALARASGSCIVRFTLMTILAATFIGCSGQDYAVVSQRDFPSPDGALLASIVEETYFNTTGYEKQLSLRHYGEKRPRFGNVRSYGPGDTVAVEWSSPTGLVVHYTYETPQPGPPPTNIYGVTITFKQSSSP
jgi:hypothetical protein